MEKSETDKISNFERDLSSLERNYFWASKYNQLNDPCEGLVTKSLFPKSMNEVFDDTISYREKLGVYSLSQTFTDELLWAHYGNSHKGFCIKYDLNILLENYSFYFPIIYNKKPPSIEIIDAVKGKNIFQKIIGYKSKRWKYEKEIRIITDNYGDNIYNYKALKAIYFGLKMGSKQKAVIMNRLKGRGIKYFQIEQLPKTYKFVEKPVEDINNVEITYLNQIPSSITNDKPVNFEIQKISYWAIPLNVSVKVKVEREINKAELKWLANTIKEKQFYNFEMIVIEFYMKTRKYSWAISTFRNGKTEIEIND